MQPKKQENRGGYRPTAGRKPLNLGEKEQANLIKAMAKQAKLTGKKPSDILADIIFDPEASMSQRLKGLELYYKTIVNTKTEVQVNTAPGPTIGLPEIQTPEQVIPEPEQLN